MEDDPSLVPFGFLKVTVLCCMNIGNWGFTLSHCIQRFFRIEYLLVDVDGLACACDTIILYAFS